MDLCHYNSTVFEPLHYFSRNYTSAITISHLFETYHYISILCVYEIFLTKLSSSSTSHLYLIPPPSLTAGVAAEPLHPRRRHGSQAAAGIPHEEHHQHEPWEATHLHGVNSLSLLQGIRVGIRARDGGGGGVGAATLALRASGRLRRL